MDIFFPQTLQAAGMDNDTLIDQARRLYALLLIKRHTQNQGHERFDRLLLLAYARYQRRLNRCAICYRYRLDDCNRAAGTDHTPCERRSAAAPPIHPPAIYAPE
ncbi:hypothetical protein ACH518_12960 [Methylomonas sp. HW2-6]|uniref:hypothetical protein n=1 Tax=Methylomonas sp. HW2-6 TaxID=3376687 RepID=UPI004042449B